MRERAVRQRDRQTDRQTDRLIGRDRERRGWANLAKANLAKKVERKQSHWPSNHTRQGQLTQAGKVPTPSNGIANPQDLLLLGEGVHDDGVQEEPFAEHPAVVAQRNELSQHVDHLAPRLQTDRQTDRQAGRQAGRQTDR